MQGWGRAGARGNQREQVAAAGAEASRCPARLFGGVGMGGSCAWLIEVDWLIDCWDRGHRMGRARGGVDVLSIESKAPKARWSNRRNRSIRFDQLPDGTSYPRRQVRFQRAVCPDTRSTNRSINRSPTGQLAQTEFSDLAVELTVRPRRGRPSNAHERMVDVIRRLKFQFLEPPGAGGPQNGPYLAAPPPFLPTPNATHTPASTAGPPLLTQNRGRGCGRSGGGGVRSARTYALGP